MTYMNGAGFTARAAGFFFLFLMPCRYFIIQFPVALRGEYEGWGGIKRPGRVILSTDWLDYVQTLLRGHCSVLIAVDRLHNTICGVGLTLNHITINQNTLWY